MGPHVCIIIWCVKDDPYFTDEDPGQSNMV